MLACSAIRGRWIDPADHVATLACGTPSRPISERSQIVSGG